MDLCWERGVRGVVLLVEADRGTSIAKYYQNGAIDLSKIHYKESIV